MPALKLDTTRGMAHEFNNILMAIAPFAELIAKRPNDARVAEYARRINAAVVRGANITHGLLSRASPSADLIDIGKMLRSLDTDFSPQPEIRSPRAPLFCAMSADAFRQATETVASVLAGSGKATRLIISAESAIHHHRQPTEGATGASQEIIHVKLRSEGFPLEPDSAELLHEVSKASDIIREGGGQLLIEQSDNGSVVHFFLVGHKERLTSLAPSRPATVKRVLLVDDDALVADAVGAMLESAGITYDIVVSASEVIPAIERTSPDIVLLDVHLGDADGTEVFREIIDRWPDLPVVFSTGHASSVELADIVGNPFVRLLQKPYALDTLIETLRTVVAGSSETA